MASEGLNRVTLIGRIDGDPYFNGAADGRKPRLWMRVRCVEEYPDQHGVPRERKQWISVVVFGARAEALSKFLRAGRRVAAIGRLSHWKREGEHPPRWETQVVAHELLLLDGAERSPTVALRPPAAGSEAA